MNIQSTQQKNTNSLLSKANVVSVGIGYKETNGKQTSEQVIVIGVTKKISVTNLSPKDVVPFEIDGTKTDVIETGVIRALPKKIKSKRTKKKIVRKRTKTKAVDPTHKLRPAPPGCSVAHISVTAGTFGCVVQKNGLRYILSNNHVLANSNDAQAGDTILQPGPHDGGSSLDKIGVLEDFVPISFEGSTNPPTLPGCNIGRAIAWGANLIAKVLGRKTRLVAVSQSNEPNYIDAAISLPDNDTDIIDEIIRIGKPSGIAVASLGMNVQKYGRTTQYTTGNILQTNATVQVSYGTNKLAIFKNQLISGPMSAGGDSGSTVLDMNGNIVGLLFAGSDSTTIFNPIQDVFTRLGITL